MTTMQANLMLHMRLKKSVPNEQITVAVNQLALCPVKPAYKVANDRHTQNNGMVQMAQYNT